MEGGEEIVEDEKGQTEKEGGAGDEEVQSG